jgi:large subunit ribosomal protein L25
MAYTLSAVTRKTKGATIRPDGQLPAVVYGAGKPTESLTLVPTEFIKLYKQAGNSSLIDVVLDGKNAGKVLVQEVQADPVTDRVLHVDFRRIDMAKPMVAPVVLKFVGEAPIVKSSGGTIVTTVSTLTVRCLPENLVSSIEVDLTGLISYDVIIKVKDLKLPAGITVINPHAEDLVVKATRALTEDEIKALEATSTATVDLSKIEAAGKKKEEDAVEGEAKPGEEGKAAAPAKAEEKKKEEKKK